MTHETKSIASRIEWCQRQSTQARAQLELEGWQAEEEGLRDALFNRDHTNQYQQRSPGLFERYALGLQDGRAVIRTAAVYQHLALPTCTEGTERTAGICEMGDVSTRHIMGLTRRADTYLHECRGTGNDKKIMGRVSSHGAQPRYIEKNFE